MIENKRLNAIKQIKKELKELQEDPIITLGVTVGLIKKDDPFHWQITMLGPQDTPYANGLFILTADFPIDYPDKGPEVKFKNKMYHLNVNNSGHVCISTLSNWVKGTTMSEVLSLIFALFYKQNPNDAYDWKMAKLFKENKAEFDKNVRECTQKYADPSKDELYE